MPERITIVAVGTGGRCTEFLDAISGAYSNRVHLIGLCDTSRTRMNWHQQRLTNQYHLPDIPKYLASDFDRMIEELRPDLVLVTTPDATHHTYVIRAMELGCDVICEKPLTTDAEKAIAIANSVKATGRNLRVAFNMRYMSAMRRVKQLLLDNAIGQPTAVDFTWLLDTSHGADYFRRWHATKAESGGLLIHKSTHHFDIVNWWLNSAPQTVFAMGGLKFYGRRNAQMRGEYYPYDRYTGHSAAQNDPFSLQLNHDSIESDPAVPDALKGLYYDAEIESGYIRDKNVFGDHVDIEDTLAVMTRYQSGVVLNYSLVAYSPWEGFRVNLTGTQGRIELSERTSPPPSTHPSNTENASHLDPATVTELQVHPMFGKPCHIQIPHQEGSHGGSDLLLMEDLFSPTPLPDPLGCRADYIDGIASMLIGACGNLSMKSGMPIHCSDVLALPERAYCEYALPN